MKQFSHMYMRSCWLGSKSSDINLNVPARATAIQLLEKAKHLCLTTNSLSARINLKTTVSFNSSSS